MSRRNPGILWVHNDDDPAILFGIDSTGTIRGRVRVRDVKNVDWEDIDVATCGSTTCIYVADIGDNKGKRTHRTIYRVTEPLVSDSMTDAPVKMPLTVAERFDDAEAVFVSHGQLYMITKGRRGAITVYALSDTLGSPASLRPITRLSAGLVQLPDMVTAAGSTPDDRFVAIRTYSAVQVYRLQNDSLQPVLKQTYDLTPLKEFQGEGLDIRDDGTMFLVSEKGLSDDAPPISRVQCTLPK